MNDIIYHPIGLIRTPFKHRADMPIQPRSTHSAEGDVVVDHAYEKGLADIDGFSHLILIFHFHRSEGFELSVKPFLDDQQRGVFSTRAPRRPNAIGLSIVPLLERNGNVLRVADIDVVDQTPLLDLKPYVPDFDAPAATAIGWLEGKVGQFREKRSDRRFME